jgi:hypothetical protein
MEDSKTIRCRNCSGEQDHVVRCAFYTQWGYECSPCKLDAYTCEDHNQIREDTAYNSHGGGYVCNAHSDLWFHPTECDESCGFECICDAWYCPMEQGNPCACQHWRRRTAYDIARYKLSRLFIPRVFVGVMTVEEPSEV